jgi:hypothetical protein
LVLELVELIVLRRDDNGEEEELYAHNMRKLAAPCIEAGGFM